MAEIRRRECMKGALALLSGVPLSGAIPTSPARQRSGFQLALHLQAGQSERCILASQIGVNHVITDVRDSLAKLPRGRYADTLGAIKDTFARNGLRLLAVESHPVPAEKIKLGLPGRDEELDNYVAAIEALSTVGVTILCYNFMAGLGWYRTRTDIPQRGGALTSEFDLQDSLKQGPTEWGVVSEETMWSNIEYFLKAVIPVAEKAKVKMAAHPDDPPVSPLRGIARILTSARNYRRVMGIVPSPVNGVTFCQANFRAMGEDVEQLAAEWCRQGKVFFVHFRDIEGGREHFRETFHDNGPTDMARMLQIYSENGFDGPIRPDHAPTLVGEVTDTPGYAMQGRVFAIGYMKGLLDGMRLPYA
jgi:mannonate dehydratase